MIIHDIAHGEQITQPGAYRVPMDWYHTQDICPGPSISSTGLRKIALQSPLAFWRTWEGNPDRYPPKDRSPSLVLGQAAHALILGDEVFSDKFAVLPDDAPKRPTEDHIRLFNHFKKWPNAEARKRAEWWAEFDKTSKGKTFISDTDVIKIGYMAENIAANPLCMELLKSDLVEISMVWQDPITGIWVKSRPDCIPSNGADFGDLKTFAPKGVDLILSAQRSITDYGYHMQMALAVEGAEHVFRTTAKECGLVFTQTSEPHEAIPIVLDEDAIYWGRVLCRKGLDTMAECMKTGVWPGIGADLTTYSFPPSMVDRFGDLQEAGELPNIGAASQ